MQTSYQSNLLCNGMVTPLILAASARYQGLVSCLLQHGANVDRAGSMKVVATQATLMW